MSDTERDQIQTPDLATTLGRDANQAFQISAGVFETWARYWTACLQARTFDDLLAANTALASDSVDLVGHVASLRQRIGGVVTPTLNDA